MTLDERVIKQLGAQTLEIIRLQSVVEDLEAQIKELKKTE